MLDYDIVFMIGVQNSFNDVVNMNEQIRKSESKIGFVFIDILQINENEFRCIYFADFGKDFIVF